MKNFRIRLFLVAALVGIALTGCEKKPFSNKSEEYRAVNEKIVEYLRAYYLWEDMLPQQIEIPDTDPFIFFDNLRRSDDIEHHWSVLSDNRESFYASMSNEGRSFGYSLSFWKMTNLDNQIWAVVQYVHPRTPADYAAIERGNIITHIGGELMTDGGPNDFRNLIYANKLDITVRNNIDDEVGHNVKMNAASGYLDPILDSKIIERGGQRIGYLMYTDYVQASESDLEALFAEFKAGGVTELILDLRYNGGGTVSTALKLASLIIPARHLDGKNIFSKFEYNEPYTALLDMVPGRKDANTLVLYPELKDLPENLGLNNVYVLTTGNTASASEQTIIGLQPFMNVVKIGTSTHGKFTGGSVLPESDNKDAMWGWGMYLIMFMYKNALGYPETNEGLVPDHEVIEDWHSYKPIGAEDDPLIAKAISLITGEPLPEGDAARVFSSPDAAPYRNAREIWKSRPGIETGMLINNYEL